jgi:hypothetical protein
MTVVCSRTLFMVILESVMTPCGQLPPTPLADRPGMGWAPARRAVCPLLSYSPSFDPFMTHLHCDTNCVKSGISFG